MTGTAWSQRERERVKETERRKDSVILQKLEDKEVRRNIIA